MAADAIAGHGLEPAMARIPANPRRSLTDPAPRAGCIGRKRSRVA
jgi:hypothetical protein